MKTKTTVIRVKKKGRMRCSRAPLITATRIRSKLRANAPSNFPNPFFDLPNSHSHHLASPHTQHPRHNLERRSVYVETAFDVATSPYCHVEKTSTTTTTATSTSFPPILLTSFSCLCKRTWFRRICACHDEMAA